MQSNPGIYRHRSYDNLQNGKSSFYAPSTPAAPYRLRKSYFHQNTMSLTHSPSFDRNSPIPLLHKTFINNNTNTNTTNSNIPPVPTEFKYYSPQRRHTRSETNVARYPFHKNRAILPRQDSEELPPAARHTSLPMRPRYKKQEVLYELKSPTNRLTLRECDFGGGGDPIESESKDSQIFRVSKRNLYQEYGSPASSRKERFSNVYEYSFNIDLNSIIEDAASDSS